MSITPPPPLMPRITGGKGKKWCFTLNNYTEDERNAIVCFIKTNCSYGIVGREVGEHGTPHLQGFIYLTKSLLLSQLKRELSERCHFERARGTNHENRRYCSKDGSFEEFGRCDGASAQPSFNAASQDFIRHMDAGGSIREYMEQYPHRWIMSGTTMLRNYLRSKEPVERPNVECEWIWGLPGVGKSRRAHQENPKAYVKDSRSIWWNGYMFEKKVIIDDFGPKGIDVNHLLRWLDRYPMYVQTKGGMCALLATKFVITSNFSPEECFKLDDGRDHPQLDALIRRMKITHM